MGAELIDSKLPDHSTIHHLAVIKCECGFEILVLPDLKAMSQAIEKHVLEHKNKGAKAAEANGIEEELIAQLFKKVSDSET